jgi:hypothetical protein
MRTPMLQRVTAHFDDASPVMKGLQDSTDTSTLQGVGDSDAFLRPTPVQGDVQGHVQGHVQAPRQAASRGYFASFGERRSRVGLLKALLGLGGKHAPSVRAQNAKRARDRANLRTFARKTQPRGFMARAFGAKPRYAWMAPESWHAQPYKDAVGRARAGVQEEPAGRATPYKPMNLDGIPIARRPKFDFGDEVPAAVEAVFGKLNAADADGTGYGGAHMKTLFPQIGVHQSRTVGDQRHSYASSNESTLPADYGADEAEDRIEGIAPERASGIAPDVDVPFSPEDLL